MGNAARSRREKPSVTPSSRVSAIVVYAPHGVPLIGTQVPAQASIDNDDYTCTALTGHVPQCDTFEEALKQALSLAFWEGLRCLPYEAVLLNKKALPSKGKQYFWYLVWLQPEATFVPDAAQIQQLVWNCPQVLPSQIALMRPGRKEMFLHCLNLAIQADQRLEVFRPVLRCR